MNRATPFTNVFRLTPGRQALPLGLNALPFGISGMSVGHAPLPTNDPCPALETPRAPRTPLVLPSYDEGEPNEEF